MKLSDLLGHNGRAAKVEIAGLSADSRKVAPGFLFAALAGTRADGTDFIEDAVSRGAVAVLAPPGVCVRDESVYLLDDDNPRRRLALLAARFFAAQPETAVAVTGTNGKSSVVAFARQIWQVLGHRAASLGTLGLVSADAAHNPGLTTPDPVALHRALKNLADRGVTHLALEASSHGLAQYRLDGVKLKAAAFTNITHEHLDYHSSPEDYFYAKMRLFGEILAPGATAVLNADSARYGDIEHLCWARGVKVLGVGRHGAGVRIEKIVPEPEGQTLTVTVEGQIYTVSLPLIGEFQAMNALIAAGLAIAAGDPPKEVIPALKTLESVPGRMQRVGRTVKGGAVYVDYAHTPDALETVLAALRPHTKSRLIVVFGCGGERDTEKRPVMGAVAVRLADRAIITDDNPRHENAAAIRAAIREGASQAEDIGDRRQAIREAVAMSEAGDVVLIAGKGHETSQIVGDRKVPFSDLQEAQKALEETGGHLD